MSFKGECAFFDAKLELEPVEKTVGLRGQHIRGRIKNAALQVG